MIPLTVRSHFSLMWGTTPVDKLCQAARQKGFSRLALTDTDNLYGLWPFLKACQQNGITPIVGAEVTEPTSDRRAVCLVENAEGYRNLCRLLSRRHQEPSFSLKQAVIEHASGLVVLTADPDLLIRWQSAGVAVAAGLPCKPDSATNKARRTARLLGLLAVATPGNFFLGPEDYEVHRVLRAIDLNTSLSRLRDSDVAPKDAWLASVEEYRRGFQIWPDAISASYAIAERLTFRGPENRTIMPAWHDPQGRDAASALRQEAYEGARRIYGDDLPEAVVNRLEHELSIIEKKEFSAYFLIVKDIIRRSPRICGRGSGAASLVAYCLGITNVCPLKHNLYFERFINESRTDPPDIDVDFAWDERDDILGSVLEQYKGHAAMVCSHVLFQPRMAIREVAKVFGLPESEINRVVKRLPWFWRYDEPGIDFQVELEAMPRMKSVDFPHPWPDILRLAQKIMGAPRYLSVHSGGVIITPEPIDSYAPVQQAPRGVHIVQWDKDGVEDSGLVKIDLLGNRSLGVIRDAIKNIRENGQSFDELHWEPEDDTATQETIARGKTMGCFYIESPAMRLLQQKTGVGDFEHLVIHSSIIRPAANDCVQQYIRRLKGAAWKPIHPLLSEILAETLGVMVYQEDVSRVAVALAGFSHADADSLRKVMARKDREMALEDYRERFIHGARARGLTQEQIHAIWAMIMSFSGYSFCKPHSASYARVSYQAAYLKTHYPAEFMAAVISNGGGFYSTFAYVSEARRLGLTILPPDVNLSAIRWKGRGAFIRVGLQAIKSLSSETQQRIISQRSQGLYRSFEDFYFRVHPDEEEAKALIHAGALDSLAEGKDHAHLLWKLARYHKKKSNPPVKSGDYQEIFLFPLEESAPYFPPGSDIERLRRQFSVLGFLVDRHPIVLFAHALPDNGLIKAAELYQHVGSRVRFAAWLITGKTIITRNGEPMEFLTFEDETSLVETTFFPKAYNRFCHMLDWGRPYLLAGLVEENFGAVTLTVDKVSVVAI